MIKENADNTTAIEKYKTSVEALLRVSQKRTGGSRVAAQVLLSAYSGDCFHLDVSDLGVLDEENIGHAFQVMWGRNCNPWMEPHRVIENGDRLFRELWDKWRGLHVQNRWKGVCYDCDGSGVQWANMEEEGNGPKETCQRCEGRGLVGEVKWPGFEREEGSGL